MDQVRTPEEVTAAWARLESESTRQLFAATLIGELDDDAPCDAVSVLRLRGTPDVFELAREFCQAANPRARTRGLDVLAQLGTGRPAEERPFLEESVSIAIRHLEESEPEVVTSAAWALCRLATESAIDALIKLKSHPDPDIREAVARCTDLPGCPKGVSCLIFLMDDENEVVRDWATFGLGSLEAFSGGEWRFPDSPEIRAALNNRLQDPYEDARREAIWGLAKREDLIGLKLLLEHLESESCWMGDRLAAEELLHVESDTPIEDLCRGLHRLLEKRRR